MRSTAQRAAFTLLEALVAVGMIMLLAGAMAMFVSDLGTTRAHVTRTTDRARSAEALFRVVETALQSAVVDGGMRGAGVSGTTNSMRVLSSRTDAAGGNAQDLARAAFAPLVATEVRQSGRNVSVGRSGQGTILPAEIGAVQLRYFDGEQWSDEFDSLSAGRLPMVVEVSMWFALEPETLTTDDQQPMEQVPVERPPPDRMRRFAVPDSLASDGAVSP
jgi:type II secretory pathway pseudopilin PulG